MQNQNIGGSEGMEGVPDVQPDAKVDNNIAPVAGSSKDDKAEDKQDLKNEGKPLTE